MQEGFQRGAFSCGARLFVVADFVSLAAALKSHRLAHAVAPPLCKKSRCASPARLQVRSPRLRLLPTFCRYMVVRWRALRLADRSPSCDIVALLAIASNRSVSLRQPLLAVSATGGARRRCPPFSPFIRHRRRASRSAAVNTYKTAQARAPWPVLFFSHAGAGKNSPPPDRFSEY